MASLRRVTRFAAALAGAALALAFVATASAQEAEAEVGGGVTSFGIGEWFGLVVRLALVVGIIWGAVVAMRWYVRRVNGGRSARGHVRAMDIIETHALGPNRALHLVRLGDRAVLVGATPERITALMAIDDPDEVRRLSEVPMEETRRPAVAGPLASLVSNLGAGLSTMNARRSRLDARRNGRGNERRAQATEAAPAAKPSAAARLNALRTSLGRPARAAEASAPAAAPRASLFDRTLASAEAAEAASPSVAGLRARAGYGRVESTEDAAPFDARASRIADLQRAIEAARRNVG